jgi:DNA-binding transcriptional MerR regulator
LRDLGLPLESIRALLNAQTSLPEVAAAHLKALDQQIQTLRLRRAVLRAAAKTNTTPEEVALMHRLAKMSDVERQHLIDDFLDDTFGDSNANPELVVMLRAMRPELPDDPEPHQVQAWVEVAELVQDPDFRASVRRMAQYQAAERDAGDRTGLHHELSDYVRERVAAALTAAVDPTGSTAAPILNDLVQRYAETLQTTDTPTYHNALLARLEIANDPRTERDLNLLHIINGWPSQPSLSPILDWFTCALRSHTSS